MLVILAMLAVMAVPTLENIFTHSEQTARNNVARTIFMAAQSALTTKYGQDAQYASSLWGTLEPVPLADITPDLTKELALGNENNDYYLAINQGSSSILRNLLEPYVNDKTIFNNTMLVEFNIETGNVLSAFYTDDPDITSLGYTTGTVILDRTPAHLAEIHVGYFGVETTGRKVTPGDLGTVSVHLADYDDDLQIPAEDRTDAIVDQQALNINGGNNYGLLTAECKLPVPLAQMATNQYTCELTLEPQVGSSETVTVTWNPVNTTADYHDTDLADSLTTALKTAGPMTDAQGRTIPAFTVTSGGSDYLVFVLDSPYTAFSIRNNFPGIGCGFLTATFTVTDGTNTSSAFSNTRHAFFAGKVKNAVEETLSVTSIRHLKNIQYNPSGNYQQLQAVSGNDYQGNKLNALKPICTADEPFTGKYDGGKKKIVMYNVAGERAALFDTVAEGAQVSYIQVEKDCSFTGEAVTGAPLAGAIACVNGGTVSHCESRAPVTATTAGGVAGGLVAQNSGTVRNSYVGANILGYSMAGGIAGSSSGDVWYCEVGTLTSGTETTAVFHGAPIFGARGGSIDNYKDVGNDPYTFDNDVFFVKAIDSSPGNGAGGGIVAVLEKGGSVRYCTNTVKVNDSIQNKEDAPEFAGGIVARAEDNDVANAIAYNYNAGSVFGAGPTGGIVGYLDCELVHCYNVARVNAQQDKENYINDLLKSRRTYLLGDVNNMGNDPAAAHPSGGIVGYGASGAKLYDSYSAHYVGAKYGGAFGIMDKDATYEGCHFQKNYYNRYNLFYVNSTGDYNSGTEFDGTDSGFPAYFRQSSADMRTLTGWNAQTTTSFQAIVNNTAVGVQNYMLPYLDFTGTGGALSDLGPSYHRTPWDRPVEEIGSIKLSNGDNIGEIYATVKVLAGRADSTYTGEVNVELTTDVQGTGAQRIKLIIDIKAELDTAAKNANGVWSGWIARHGDDATGNDGHTYSYRARVATADEKLLGYEYVYQVKFFWDTPGSGFSYMDFLPAGATTVTATLYERKKDTFADGLEYDRDTLTRELGGLTFIEDYPILGTLSANVLQIDIVNPLENGTLHLSVAYLGSGKTYNNCITLSPAIINYANANENNYLSVYNNQSMRITFNAGASSNGETLLYKTGGKYYLILYRDGILISSDFKRPNGFLTNDPFVVTMKYKGKDYTTAPQTFTVPAS